MKRFMPMLVVAASLSFSFGGPAESVEKSSSPANKGYPMFKAIVHINFADADQHKHGLKNIANMLKEVNDKAEIVVVCHGAGILLLVSGESKHAGEVARLAKEGVVFAACENTMREKSISKEKLLPQVVTVPSGAVEVVRRQQEGYGYFKP